MNAIDKISTETAQPVDLDEVRATKAERDPGKTAEALANDRIITLVQELQRGGIGNLTELRDQIDDLMRHRPSDRA